MRWKRDSRFKPHSSLFILLKISLINSAQWRVGKPHDDNSAYKRFCKYSPLYNPTHRWSRLSM